MGYIKKLIRARRYRSKESVTPDEFIKALEADLGRSLDPESQLFFRYHPISVNLVNKILSGQLKSSNDEEKNNLVLKAITMDMMEYTPTFKNLDINPNTIIADLVEEFSKIYNDAGNIIGQTLITFLRLK